jgi:hypothetical protein
MRDRLRFRHADLEEGKETRLAEKGLDFPRSAYWYVQRSEGAFGRIGVLWTPNRLGKLGSTSGATAFDTGGLWFEYIKTEPPMPDPSERARFAHEQMAAGAELEERFSAWLAAGYPDDPVAYLFGKVPQDHVAKIICDAKVNEARAWSWELRIDVRAVKSTELAPDEIYWTEADYEAFEAWIQLEDDLLSATEQSTLLDRCQSMSIFDEEPKTAVIERLRETVS